MLARTSAARIAALVLLPGLHVAPTAQAVPTLVFSHGGCADPATIDPDPSIETWTLDDLVAPGAVAAACGDSGTDAWELSDADSTLAGPRYRRDPTGAPDLSSGWTLRARVRARDLADAPDGSALLEAAVAGRRFRLSLGSDGVGNTQVHREGVATDLIAQAPAFEETGYHLYEIAFDPTDGALGRADLFIDGLLVGPDWDGAATLDSRIAF